MIEDARGFVAGATGVPLLGMAAAPRDKKAATTPERDHEGEFTWLSRQSRAAARKKPRFWEWSEHSLYLHVLVAAATILKHTSHKSRPITVADISDKVTELWEKQVAARARVIAGVEDETKRAWLTAAVAELGAPVMIGDAEYAKTMSFSAQLGGDGNFPNLEWLARQAECEATSSLEDVEALANAMVDSEAAGAGTLGIASPGAEVALEFNPRYEQVNELKGRIEELRLSLKPVPQPDEIYWHGFAAEEPDGFEEVCVCLTKHWDFSKLGYQLLEFYVRRMMVAANWAGGEDVARQITTFVSQYGADKV
jgi:hypothetical protein